MALVVEVTRMIGCERLCKTALSVRNKARMNFHSNASGANLGLILIILRPDVYHARHRNSRYDVLFKIFNLKLALNKS